MAINRAFVYGDLLIETMAVVNGKIRNEVLHFERLTSSARQLGFELPENWSLDYFNQLVTVQCPEKNMRARLITYRAGNGFYLSNTSEVSFDVNYWPPPAPKTSVDEIGLYPDQLKACTPLSNLKSGNALLYVLASKFAAANGWDEVLILNTNRRIAEASSSNVFWVKGGLIHTPPLSEAPVDGVMREALIAGLHRIGLGVEDKALSVDELLAADECFLTNAIHPLVSVKKFGPARFTCELTEAIRKELKY